MKRFNTTGVCIPSKHYMVDLSGRVDEITKMVDEGKYFCINRARQYGKTTTLRALQLSLKSKYIVLSLSLEGITKSGYRTEGEFVQTFARIILDRVEFGKMTIPESTVDALTELCAREASVIKTDELFREFRMWITVSGRPIVLLIDEIDSSTNNQVFLDFLGLLRDGYLMREAEGMPAFQSVRLE